MYDEAREDDEGFWARQAADLLVTWTKEWDTICEWELPFAKWFVGGELNVSYNCLDRHVLAGSGDKVAFHFEGEPGDTRTRHVRRPARRDAAVRQRAEVARRREGRPRQHLPADDPRGRGRDARLRADRRRAQRRVRRVQRDSRCPTGSTTPRPRCSSPPTAATAAARSSRSSRSPTRRSPSTPTITHVVVVRRGGNDVPMTEGRDHWYHELMADADPRVPRRADGLRAAAVPALHVAARRASRRASCTRAAAT